VTQLLLQRQPRQEAWQATSTGAKRDDSPPRGKRIPGQPPKLSDAEEDSFRKQGEAKLGELSPATTSSEAGHTTPGPIAGFPDWFVKLQVTLIESTEWRPEKEEKAQNLLAEYALQRFAKEHDGDRSKVPPTVRVFLEHIGRSTSNVDAATAAKLPSAGDLGGSNNAINWCAQAGSSSVLLALKAAGLTFDGVDPERWLKYPPGVGGVNFPDVMVDAKIEPGDQVSYVEAGLRAVGGHTVTALTDSQGEGTTFEHASGNAGGGKAGSVRLGSTKPRGKAPASITYVDLTTKTGKALNPPDGMPAGVIWIHAITKYSKFWENLRTINFASANPWQSTEGKAFLAKHKLKVKPVKA
jgi:hypothetical protein